MTQTTARGARRLPRQLQREVVDGRAGASAQRKYRQMRASWRRRTRRRFAIFFGGYLALVLAPVHVVTVTVASPVWIYTAGMLTGVGLTEAPWVRWRFDDGHGILPGDGHVAARWRT